MGLLLKCEHVGFGYENQDAVLDVNLEVNEGDYICIVGENGSGKSTLMKGILGLLKPTSGRISLNGKTVEQLGERYYTHLGYMPQDFGFYPDFTAREFMLYMAAVMGLDPKERVRFRNLISDFAKEKIVILSTHIVSDV